MFSQYTPKIKNWELSSYGIMLEFIEAPALSQMIPQGLKNME